MPPRLLAFGSNGSGQLGVGHRDDISAPQPCLFAPEGWWQPGETIRDIAAGGNHTLVLTSAGRVFAAGSNEKGQCGISGAPDFSSRFEAVADIGDLGSGQGVVTHVAATWEASFFVYDEQKIYSCGTGSKGELGLGPGRVATHVPSLVLDLSSIAKGLKVTRLAAAMSHVVLMTDDGDLFGWGASRKGQIGEESVPDRVVWSPLRISLRNQACSIAVGRNFTYIVDVTGKGHLLGERKHFGGLASLSESREDVIFAGWSQIFAWSGNRLAAVGNSNHGQLPPQQLASPRLFASGSEHSLALLHNGIVVAWGWGEHGNCGVPLDDRGSVADRVNEIPVPQERDESISLLAAGCATSFIVLARKGDKISGDISQTDL